MVQKKYKLLWSEKMLLTYHQQDDIPLKVRMRRIVALIDIPRHGVKAGDMGGWVSNGSILSHEGDCWIGGTAKVSHSGSKVKVGGNALIDGDVSIWAHQSSYLEIAGNARILGKSDFHYDRDIRGTIGGDALIEDNAYIIGASEIFGHVSDSATVREKVKILAQASVSGSAKVKKNCVISNNAVIKGRALIGADSKVSGYAVISDDAVLSENVSVSGDVQIGGHASVGENSIISGKARIMDNARVANSVHVKENAVIKDYAFVGEKSVICGSSILSGRTKIPADEIVKDMELADYGSVIALSAGSAINPSFPVLPAGAKGPNVVAAQEKLAELTQAIESYESDIIKILKYPMMTDLSYETTLDMSMALRSVNDFDPIDSPKKFCKLVKALERKFLVAESNAHKMSMSVFSDEQRKKSETAKKLYAVACDESSSEPEKRTAFKQVFRQLEGVAVIPDSAVSAFKVKVGISELEA